MERSAHGLGSGRSAALGSEEESMLEDAETLRQFLNPCSNEAASGRSATDWTRRRSPASPRLCAPWSIARGRRLRLTIPPASVRTWPTARPGRLRLAAPPSGVPVAGRARLPSHRPGGPWFESVTVFRWGRCEPRSGHRGPVDGVDREDEGVNRGPGSCGSRVSSARNREDAVLLRSPNILSRKSSATSGDEGEPAHRPGGCRPGF
jgi:hypothetical protein